MIRTAARAGSEDGLSLVEVLVALALMSVVVSTVFVSVSVISARTASLADSTTAMDRLQTAEQTIVQAVHAASSWCEPVPAPAYGCTEPTDAPTSNDLSFTAQLNGTTAAYEFTIEVAHGVGSLVMSKNGQKTTLLTDLDPSSSLTGFTPKSVTVGDSTYYTTIGITLTVDSPRPGAPHVTRTTAADSAVIAWNVEYACSAAQEATGGGPC